MVQGKRARSAIALATVAIAFLMVSPAVVSPAAGRPVAGIDLPGVNAAAGAAVVALTPPSAAAMVPAARPATPVTAPPVPAPPVPAHVPDDGRANVSVTEDENVSVWDLPAGSLILNTVSGRQEVIDPGIAGQAVLFGDSQASGSKGVQAADTWVAKGLTARGYKVRFVGAGGTGFVAKTAQAENYPDAVESGKVLLPFGNPAIVVVQGGGNDAGTGVSDTQILANASRLLRDLKSSYPRSEFLFIGTVAKGSSAGGGRRTQVDAVLAGFAKRNGIQFVSAGDWLTRYKVTQKMADGVHLTAAGHQDLAFALAGELKLMGLQGPGPS